MKANVIFFERKEASEKPWTQDLWIYDLRTNQHFTLKTNPANESDLEDFVRCFKERDPEGFWAGGSDQLLEKAFETKKFWEFRKLASPVSAPLQLCLKKLLDSRLCCFGYTIAPTRRRYRWIRSFLHWS